MITPSYGLTATERVLPKLSLDFTTASLDSRITFTRTGNTATVTNSSGTIVGINANLPRFDYNPVTLACRGLLIEEARNNLLLYSDDFSNAVWSTFQATIITNVINSPDGTQNADFFVPTATSGDHVLNQTLISVNLATSRIFSMYLKPEKLTSIILTLRNQSQSIGIQAVVNLTNLTVSSANYGSPLSAITPTITNVGNGWYRVSMGGALSNTTENLRLGLVITSTGNNADGVYIWGAQIEPGTFSTSYIPTAATSVTRNADVAVMTGTNFSSWWTATNGASDVWLVPKSTATLAYLSFDDATANNAIVIANSTTSGQSKITSGGSLQATLTAGTITANATNKVGCSWNTNNCAATANATAPATTSSATIPTVSQLRLGGDGTNYANAWLQKVFYWPQRITNNEIQAFTK